MSNNSKWAKMAEKKCKMNEKCIVVKIRNTAKEGKITEN